MVCSIDWENLTAPQPEIDSGSEELSCPQKRALCSPPKRPILYNTVLKRIIFVTLTSMFTYVGSRDAGTSFVGHH